MFPLSDTNKTTPSNIFSWKTIQHYFNEAMLLCMGGLIVYFNVSGYEELFSIKDKLLGPFSAFGLMLVAAEFSVLMFSRSVISNWPDSGRFLRTILMMLTLAFWSLSFTGINSYLKSLSAHEESEVQAATSIREHQRADIDRLTTRRAQYNQDIANLKERGDVLSSTIQKNQTTIDQYTDKMNQRRRAVADCSAVADCNSQVQVYQQQINSLATSVKVDQDQLVSISKQLTELGDEVNSTSRQIRDYTDKAEQNLTKNAGSEFKISAKQQFYEEIVNKICHWFGYKPEHPFDFFIAFIAMLVYPVYFSLNLLAALNSEENRAARASHRQQLIENHCENAARQEFISVMNKLLWLTLPRILMAGKTVLFFLIHELWNAVQRSVSELKALLHWLRSLGTGIFNPRQRLMKYLRVWARRRQKIREKEVECLVEVEKIVEKEVEKRIEVPVEVEVEKIVERIKEVPIEVEKLVEKIKEVPVEVRIEVPVEVERLIPVDKEIPVYIERIQKVPEPYFIPDPQVVIHERIIPVPEDITAKELEELLNAQPRLNTAIRDEKIETARSEEQQDERTGPTAAAA